MQGRNGNNLWTHGKHAQLREQVNGQVTHHFLLVEQPKA